MLSTGDGNCFLAEELRCLKDRCTSPRSVIDLRLGRLLGYLIFSLMALMGDPMYYYFSKGGGGAQPRKLQRALLLKEHRSNVDIAFPAADGDSDSELSA